MKSFKLPTRKQKYDVYIEGHGYGVYKKEYKKIFCGSTVAVSEAQAINNVRFRNGDKESIYIQDDYMDEGYVVFEYHAYPQ